MLGSRMEVASWDIEILLEIIVFVGLCQWFNWVEGWDGLNGKFDLRKSVDGEHRKLGEEVGYLELPSNTFSNFYFVNPSKPNGWITKR